MDSRDAEQKSGGHFLAKGKRRNSKKIAKRSRHKNPTSSSP
jgi:hypothetical protein